MQEGFQPTTFRSSRTARATAAAPLAAGDMEVQAQASEQNQGRFKQASIEDFLDQDELEERARSRLTVKVRSPHVMGTGLTTARQEICTYSA